MFRLSQIALNVYVTERKKKKTKRDGQAKKETIRHCQRQTTTDRQGHRYRHRQRQTESRRRKRHTDIQAEEDRQTQTPAQIRTDRQTDRQGQTDSKQRTRQTGRQSLGRQRDRQRDQFESTPVVNGDLSNYSLDMRVQLSFHFNQSIKVFFNFYYNNVKFI